MTDEIPWAEYRQFMTSRSKAKRARNRENAKSLLYASGLVYDTNNDGAHYRIELSTETLDFWPGTGKWQGSLGASGRGIFDMFTYIRGCGGSLATPHTPQTSELPDYNDIPLPEEPC